MLNLILIQAAYGPKVISFVTFSLFQKSKCTTNEVIKQTIEAVTEI